MIWEKVPFESLYLIPSRNGLTRPQRVRGSGHKMVNMGELFKYDRITSDIEMELVPMNNKELTNTVLESGDILFARQSLVREGAGKCSIILDVNEVLTFESHLIRIRLNTKVANPLFYYYYFSSSVSNMQTIIQQCAQAGIRGSELTKLEVHKPPMVIQNKIANILSAYDDLIELNNRRIKLLYNAGKNLYKQWFIHFKYPGSHINEAFKSWSKQKINDIGKVITGKTPSTKNPDFYGGEVPFIKTPDMHGNIFITKTGNYLTELGAGAQKNKYIPENTLIVSCIGTIGVVAITSQASQTNQQINSVILNKNYYLYYCYYAFQSLKEQMEALGGGATMSNVNKTKFENLEIVFPEENLLQDFNDLCEPIFEQILNLQKQNEKLSQARDLLVNRLMRGEIKV
ncbi:hypothetical protein GLW08_14970 [Pontibacillus yanchengensis]|uniref:Uncharacterized protein n=2 Tax=Pontibacillus yanchengensis TaxID=462910 RepID=A0ACC7VI62_9BACI|nr:restriction endonuclease subunit S [Pontibacillus yanchengensis]MYL35560.1 hypothetical protein [Pontibacillus yanchengensis]MYL54636.1 hypothetical protein [Pontibacillus yanchengensis]